MSSTQAQLQNTIKNLREKSNQIQLEIENANLKLLNEQQSARVKTLERDCLAKDKLLKKLRACAASCTCPSGRRRKAVGNGIASTRLEDEDFDDTSTPPDTGPNIPGSIMGQQPGSYNKKMVEERWEDFKKLEPVEVFKGEFRCQRTHMRWRWGALKLYHCSGTSWLMISSDKSLDDRPNFIFRMSSFKNWPIRAPTGRQIGLPVTQDTLEVRFENNDFIRDFYKKLSVARRDSLTKRHLPHP